MKNDLQIDKKITGISVVIPYYNNQDLLYSNLPSVIQALVNSTYPYEIILVDDCSTKGDITQAIDQKYKEKFVILKNSKNLGFSKTANFGIKNAKYDFVLLLNTDIKLFKDSLREILKSFEDEKLFGIGLHQLIITKDKKYDGCLGGGKFTFGMIRHFPLKLPDKPSNTFYVSGGAGIFDCQKLLKLGGFDEIFSPFYFEDVDLSFRALKMGWKVLCDPSRVVEHRHETTITKSRKKLYIKTVAQRNWIIFNWKNLDVLNLASHIFWLPANILRELFIGNFYFILGLFWATIYIPKIIMIRKKQKFIKKDKELLNLLR